MKKLTKEQMFKLFRIATGCIDRSYNYIDEMGVNSICIEDSGYLAHHFCIIQQGDKDIDCRYGDVFDFVYKTTDLRMDNPKTVQIKNHRLLHKKLEEFGFYYNTSTLN